MGNQVVGRVFAVGVAVAGLGWLLALAWPFDWRGSSFWSLEWLLAGLAVVALVTVVVAMSSARILRAVLLMWVTCVVALAVLLVASELTGGAVSEVLLTLAVSLLWGSIAFAIWALTAAALTQMMLLPGRLREHSAARVR